MSGDWVAETSAMMALVSSRRRRAKCAASLERPASRSSDFVMEFAVVSHRPGSCGSVKDGRIEIDVGNGSCKEKDVRGESSTWAICEFEMLSYTSAMALARDDC